jgi:adenylate cyclase
MPTVLIVDDEPAVLRTLKRLFHRRGFEVRCASSPAQALKIAGAERPDVVISDFKMPEMNGARLLKEIAACAPATLRILLSGQIDIAGEAISLAGVQILPKPWDEEKLLRACQRSKD